MDRKRAYFWLMGCCVALIVLAWTVVKDVSLVAAAVMTVVAAVIPPVASAVANFGVLSGRRKLDFDEVPTWRRGGHEYGGHDDL
ncbi:DUF3099 domain-containing protein [Nocardioides sp. HDW12B]|uniref:DUF3099 domain-containing protein n=1 Tax=Nocardioides sp. HDW12B TaxID=2714939 RepID=UPI00140D2B0D|nr:DUF3099 domain-containing protein [Nocardioides sp. HDW12B]QIK65882.1 DUF3099 domain-containing protein [Nocardioides sp. HDW12B]